MISGSEGVGVRDSSGVGDSIRRKQRQGVGEVSGAGNNSLQKQLQRCQFGVSEGDNQR